MPIWAWVSLGVFLLLAVSTGVFALVQGIRLWRRVRALEQSVGVPLEQLVAAVDQLNARAEVASARAQDVEQRLADLRASLDKLGVLGWALGDTRDLARRWRSISSK